MSYTLLSSGRSGWARSKMITISDKTILFTIAFRNKFEVKRFITLYSNDDGFLCFKFSDERQPCSYRVTLGTKGAYFFRTPTFLQGLLPQGSYTVVMKDGYFVTDCKLKKEDEKNAKV